MTPSRHPALPAALLALAVTLAGCAGAPSATTSAAGETDGYPVTVDSCNFRSSVDAPPSRAITMNQGATEVVLALGAEDRLAGTAYLDDEVPEKWRAAYESVPVLSPEYPDHESLLAAEPDFVYASYVSAFDKEVAGSPQELEELGIGAYTSPLGCGDDDLPAVTFATVWDEVDTVAHVFGVPERAADLRAAQEEQLATLADEEAGAGTEVFWFDSGDKTALAGAGEGGPQLILEAIGATNVFADLPGGWADVSWEKVVEADPDVIVLADASWSSAKDKIAFLRKDPALRRLAAVRDERFVVLPYSESTPGVRLVDGARTVADGLDALERR
jgi:iron complex transport system substrate-binding protein